MANRVLFGSRGGQYGFWVSKPGHNVLSATDDNMLISTTRRNVQVIKSGILYSPAAGTHQITLPNMGFYPVFLVSSPRYATSFTYASHSQMNLVVGSARSFDWPAAIVTPPNPPYEVRWAALNVRAVGA